MRVGGPLGLGLNAMQVGVQLGQAMRQAKVQEAMLPLEMQRIGVQMEADKAQVATSQWQLEQAKQEEAKWMNSDLPTIQKWEQEYDTPQKRAEATPPSLQTRKGLAWLAQVNQFQDNYRLSEAAESRRAAVTMNIKNYVDRVHDLTAKGWEVPSELNNFPSTGPTKANWDALTKEEASHSDWMQFNADVMRQQSDKLVASGTHEWKQVLNSRTGVLEWVAAPKSSQTPEALAVNARELYKRRADAIDAQNKKDELALKNAEPLPSRESLDAELEAIDSKLKELGQVIPAKPVKAAVPKMDKLSSGSVSGIGTMRDFQQWKQSKTNSPAKK